MPKTRLLAALMCLCLAASAQAAERVGDVIYTKSKDPITDVNTSTLLLPEVNTTDNRTYTAIRCSSGERSQLWMMMTSKNEMMPADDYAAGFKPMVQVRLGSDTPLTLNESDLLGVVRDGDHDGQTLGFQTPITRRIVGGLREGKRLVVRVYRASGGQPLTYTYSANGFARAWAAVDGCGVSGTTPARGGASGAPKFTRWYFTTCRDEASGRTQTGLVAGRAARCELVVETVPNGSRLTSAKFRYELEYKEGGRMRTLKLDGVDYWPASAYGGTAEMSERGNNLVFQLPLAVRARPDRVYTSINVTGELNFGGDVKRVYEPLPVRLR